MEEETRKPPQPFASPAQPWDKIASRELGWTFTHTTVLHQSWNTAGLMDLWQASVKWERLSPNKESELKISWHKQLRQRL